MSEMTPTYTNSLQQIRGILAASRSQALRSVNAAMLSAYWEIGREIVEEEQRGQARARYGRQLIGQLSMRLTEEFGKGFGPRNLRHIRQFYLTFATRTPPISFAAGEPRQIRNEARSKMVAAESQPLSADLSWTHYRLLMRVKDEQARSFYEQEALRTKWSTADLERQVSSLLFERLAMSRDKKAVLALAEEGQTIQRPEDLIKDPYILEFTGLEERSHWQESDLEQVLVAHLQQFLLELGNDLFFVARQKRLSIDGDHFYIDLVFYHRELRCFLLIDLKSGRLTQQDVGQMLLYTGYYATEEMREGENPAIGLILCTDKNEAAVRYTLSQSASKIFTSRYQLHLPSEEQLRAELMRERELIEAHRLLEE